MSRINTNVDSLIALNNLSRVNKQLGTSLTRLSTGLRINSGKDDPAGLIAGEFLRQEISAVDSAIKNNNRANSMLGTADAALAEIASLLDSIRGTVTATANTGVLSEEEIEANQAFVDSALSSINRISNTSQFAGRKLLDGSLGFATSGLSIGGAGDELVDVRINQVSSGTDSTNPLTVDVALTVSFQQATVQIATTGLGASNASISLQVVGNQGAAVIELTTDSSSDISATVFAAAVNAVSDVTGVTATTGGLLESVEFGSAEFVTARVVDGDDLILGGFLELNDVGVDAEGTINGQSFQGIGRRALLKAGNLDMEVTFSTDQVAGATDSFQITGGGVQFQLGLEVDTGSQINIGIQSVHSAVLGSNEIGRLASIKIGGANNLINGDRNQAAAIVKLAAAQIGGLRAQLGALQKNTIETNVNSLQVAKENLASARSLIVDTDFAAETATLTRLQILVQAGTSSLAIANARPQSVLALLG